MDKRVIARIRAYFKEVGYDWEPPSKPMDECTDIEFYQNISPATYQTHLGEMILDKLDILLERTK